MQSYWSISGQSSSFPLPQKCIWPLAPAVSGPVSSNFETSDACVTLSSGKFVSLRQEKEKRRFIASPVEKCCFSSLCNCISDRVITPHEGDNLLLWIYMWVIEESVGFSCIIFYLSLQVIDGDWSEVTLKAIGALRGHCEEQQVWKIIKFGS